MENKNKVRNIELCVMICSILFSVLTGLYLQSVTYAQSMSRVQQIQQKKPAIYVTKEKLEYGFEFTMKAASKYNLNPDRTAAAYLAGHVHAFEIGGYSLQKLYRQLRHNGFTHDETCIAIACLKVYLKLDFSEQAYISAKRYMNILTTKEILEKWLTIDGYEKEEIKYAIEKIKLDILRYKTQRREFK